MLAEPSRTGALPPTVMRFTLTPSHPLIMQSPRCRAVTSFRPHTATFPQSTPDAQKLPYPLTFDSPLYRL